MCRTYYKTRPQFLQCKDVMNFNPYFIQRGQCVIVERTVEGHIKKFILKPGAKVKSASSPFFSHLLFPGLNLKNSLSS